MTITTRRNPRTRRRFRKPTSDTYTACREVLNVMLSKNSNVKTVEEFRANLQKLASNKKIWVSLDAAMKELAKAKLVIEEIY
jgi:hypothetical protein